MAHQTATTPLPSVSLPEDCPYQLTAHPQYGFLQITPTPTPEEITKFYADEFYSAYPNFNDSALEVQQRDKAWYDLHREAMTRQMSKILNRPLKGLKLLDIGCGWGEALFYFQSKGLQPFGFDPAPEAIAYGKKRGLNVVTAGMNKMSVFSPQQFDVVTLLNVLEHLADPVAVLEEIRDVVLAPGGLLIIDVPNEFNGFQTAGQEIHKLPPWWVAPPGHLNYFSASTLNQLLQGLGFKVHMTEASFPLEIFLLFGDNYVGNGPLGRTCHEKRMAFETHLVHTGREELLHQFYQSLAQLNLGRQVIAYATKDSTP